MKLKIALILFFSPLLASTQVEFSKYFKNSSLRFDYLIAGDSKNITIYPEQIIKEPFWGGSKTNLIDPFDFGTYSFKVYDLKSDSLIFSKGFSTLFQEWQTTADAKTSTKAYYHATVFPFPKKNVRLEIDVRRWDGSFENIYAIEINPNDYHIKTENLPKYETKLILKNGAFETTVDLVILAEGYVKSEKKDFYDDVERIIEYVFNQSPFDEAKDKFNVTALFVPSMESGTDMPREFSYKNTPFNSTFNTFDLPRYLTSNDIKNIYNAASTVPYDQIFLLVNTDRYGGGGFYNYLNVSSADNELSEKVFLHEFGHGFAGLGDEYYSSKVSYENFYNIEIEPWEPNLTTLTDFDKKWKNLITDTMPIPTPRRIKYNNQIGVFEGGGYLSEGIYSPMMDCRMKSNTTDHFCPVCEDAIKKMIKYYTE